jgi:3'-5' exoribonuclease
MAKLFVSEINEGMTIESIFLCNHKALLKDKNGKPYLNVQLADRSGFVEGRIWERALQFNQNFNKFDYVRIKGNVVTFQGRLQLNVQDIQVISIDAISRDDFLPHTKQDIEQMYGELLEICRRDFQNPHVKSLILSILEDEEMGPLFKRAPAAKSNHHAWIGGLLEHVLQLVKVGRDVLPHYPMANGDLVLAGLILHDFGKIYELSAERALEYTDRGQLVGHLMISVEILLKKAAKQPDFPEKILHHLQHILLSHHGQLEYGSPKEPMTLEALMVHHLDNMDSKLQGFLDTLAREQEGDSNWTASGFLFKRPLYKKTSTDMGIEQNASENIIKKSKPVSAETTEHKAPKKHPHEKRPHPSQPLKTNLGSLLSEKLQKKSP